MIFFRVTPTGEIPSSVNGAKVLTGELEPTSTIGTNGDIYLQIGNQGSLLHFDEDFTDEGDHTWTIATGTGEVSDEQSKFGGKSLKLTAGILQSETNEMFIPGAEDFTISLWVYPTVTSRIALFATHGTGIAMDLHYNGDANLWASSTGNSWDVIQSDNSGSANAGNGTITVNTNEWTHIAYVRKGGKCMSFVNGVLSKEVSISEIANLKGSGKFNIGGWNNLSQYPYTGYIDDFMYLKGVALWEDAFTPPTEPMTLPIICKKAFRKVDNAWVEIENTSINELGSFTEPYAANLKVLNGTAIPSSDLGNNGDIYLKAENDVITSAYQKVNGEWQSLISSPINEKTIVEPMSMYSGSDAPTSILGKNNDLYLRSVNNNLLPQIKINGSWQDLATTNIEDIFFAKPIPAGIYGYTQLSYIKSDGNSWINPNLRYTTDMELEFGGRWDSVVTAEQHFFGLWVSARECNFGAYNSTYFYELGGSGTEAAITMDTNYHIIKVTQSQLLIDDTSIGTAPNWNNIVTDMDIYMLCRNISNTPQNFGTNFEFGYCKIWQGGNLIRDFVPCKRNYDNAIGLYDKVNDKFYQNNGTGEIIAGPVITGGGNNL